jgi:hypothetical protein
MMRPEVVVTVLALGTLTACATAGSVGRPAVPKCLPKVLSPAANGCDYAHPERTPAACENWGEMMTDGLSWPCQKVGRLMLGLLCDLGRADSCASAAATIEREEDRDAVLEQRYRDTACRLGLADECNVDVKAQLAEQVAHRQALQRECDEGRGASCWEYGGWLWGYAHYDEGEKLFVRACELGYENGCYRVRRAREFREGKGPP